MPYHYGVLCLNRRTEFDSRESPERFLQMAQQFHQLFGMELPEYEIWQNDGIWIPLHGVRDLTQTVLLPDALDKTENQNAAVIGQRILSNHRSWQLELQGIRKCGGPRESWQDRLELVERNIATVNRLIEMVKETQVQHQDVSYLFTRMTQAGVRQSDQSVALEMNVSLATLYRMKKRLIKSLGDCSIRRLTHKELNKLLQE